MSLHEFEEGMGGGQVRGGRVCGGALLVDDAGLCFSGKQVVDLQGGAIFGSFIGGALIMQEPEILPNKTNS